MSISGFVARRGGAAGQTYIPRVVKTTAVCRLYLNVAEDEDMAQPAVGI